MSLTDKMERVLNILKENTYSISAISWKTYIHNEEVKSILDNSIVEQRGNKFRLNFKFPFNSSYKLIKIKGKMYMIVERDEKFIVSKA